GGRRRGDACDNRPGDRPQPAAAPGICGPGPGLNGTQMNTDKTDRHELVTSCPTWPRSAVRQLLKAGCRPGACWPHRLARAGRLHRGKQACNTEVGRYPRRRWLFWTATSKLYWVETLSQTISAYAWENPCQAELVPSDWLATQPACS